MQKKIIKSMTNEEQNKMIMGWIGEMEAAGLSYDSMLEVFRMARVKLEVKLKQADKVDAWFCRCKSAVDVLHLTDLNPYSLCDVCGKEIL